jgi:hypothetical protein
MTQELKDLITCIVLFALASAALLAYGVQAF